MGGRYLYNVAVSAIGELKIITTDLGVNDSDNPCERLLTNRGEEIREWLGRMSPHTLGRIIACSRFWQTETFSTEVATAFRFESSPLKGKGILVRIASLAVADEVSRVLARDRQDYIHS